MFFVGIYNLAILGNQESGELILWILIGFCIPTLYIISINLEVNIITC
jgi:hypothetical protein